MIGAGKVCVHAEHNFTAIARDNLLWDGSKNCYKLLRPPQRDCSLFYRLIHLERLKEIFFYRNLIALFFSRVVCLKTVASEKVQISAELVLVYVIKNIETVYDSFLVLRRSVEL